MPSRAQAGLDAHDHPDDGGRSYPLVAPVGRRRHHRRARDDRRPRRLRPVRDVRPHRSGRRSDVLNVDSTHAGTTTVHAANGDDRMFVEASVGHHDDPGPGRRRLARRQRRPRRRPASTRWTASSSTSTAARLRHYRRRPFGRRQQPHRRHRHRLRRRHQRARGRTARRTSDTFLFRRNAPAPDRPALGTRHRHPASTPPRRRSPTPTASTAASCSTARGGDDTFALDDTSPSSPSTATPATTASGSASCTPRTLADAEFGIPAAEFFTSTRGLLPAASRSRRALGGTGDDVFEVFRNVATLNLYGDAGDDTFVVRSFVGESGRDRRSTPGEGRDFIQYATNAPVNIDGGAGNDLVVVIGTEVGDTFVITADGRLRRRPVRARTSTSSGSRSTAWRATTLLRRLDQPRRRDQHLRRPRQRPHRGRRAGPGRAGRRPARPHRPGPQLRREHRRGQRLGAASRSTASRAEIIDDDAPAALGRHHRRHRSWSASAARRVYRHRCGSPSGRRRPRSRSPSSPRPIDINGRSRALELSHRRRRHLADLGHPRLRGGSTTAQRCGSARCSTTPPRATCWCRCRRWWRAA